MAPSASTAAAPRMVVGVGASGGALDALRDLLRPFAPSNDLAFLVVPTSLEDHERSGLRRSLEETTDLPVFEAHAGLQIESGRVYLVGPGFELELESGQLQLTHRDLKTPDRWPIDTLFSSLARVFDDRSAAIVLSGAGQDGTNGLRSIKAHGGLSLAQDPSTAAEPSMPASVIEARLVDRVLEPREMGSFLATVALDLKGGDRAGNTQSDDADLLRNVTRLLKTEGTFDPEAYRESTLRRRLSRRMVLASSTDEGAYLERLATSAEERSMLVRDLMVSVTAFFRDPASWAAVEREVLPSLVAELDPAAPFRAWVPGCATGEEAYTLTMLLVEALEGAKRSADDLTVFATDVDEDALTVARAGIYSSSDVEPISDTRRSRFFAVTDDGRYRVEPFLRDRISFARHDVTTDPPFSRLSFISCRNLLIYIRKVRQRRILESFAFVLRGGGALFLGDSETVGVASEYFLAAEGEGARIFRTRDVSIPLPVVSPRVPSLVRPAREPEVAVRRGLEALLPPSVVVGGDGRILYVHGDVTRYLRVPSGTPSGSFFDALADPFQLRVRAAFFQSSSEGQPAEVTVRSEDANVRIELAPVAGTSHIAVAFHRVETEARALPGPATDAEREELELELERVRTDLRLTVSELAIANENLRVANEEATSVNEELQSSNEELESTSEELRSLNEELSKVNQQLREKVSELQRNNDDLSNFFSSTDLATLFLDDELRIKRYTPVAGRLLGLNGTLIGHAIGDMPPSSLVAPELATAARRVIESLASEEEEIPIGEARFVRRILPYRTQDRRIDGVIIHFIDISQIQRSRDEAARAHRHQAALTHMGLAALDLVPSAQTLQRLVAEVQRSLAADLTGWFELTDEGKKLILRAGYGWNEPNVAFRVSSSNPVALALQQAGPVAVGDIREMRFESIPVLHHEDVISLVACAVHARPGTLGVLAVFSRRKAGFDAFDATFLEGATHVFAHAADRDRAEAELREARRVAENEKSRLERLFMEAPALIALHEGPEHVYTFSNRLHDEALGRRPLLGRSVREAVPEVIGSGVIERFDDVYRTGTPALVGEFDIDLPGPGGKGRTTRQFSQVVQRHHDPEGRPVGVMTFAMDVTDQVEARRKVEESEGRLQRTADELRVIYDTAPVGLALMNRNMEWVRLNPSLAQLDGHTVDEHLGRSLPDLLQETGSVIAVDIERVFVTGEPVMGVEVEVNREGEERSFVASYIPLWNDTRTEVRLVSAVVQETTDAKRYQQALIEAGQRRDEFLAMLSHELRNPVAAINNAVELLAMEDRREEDLHASVDVLGRQAVHMTRMVDDLLDAARLSRGKVSLHKTALDLGRLVKGVVADHQAAADRAHVLLKSRRLDREVEVLGDATRLTQILSNLLTNAVRFTPPQGEVQVEMRPLPGAVQVRVTDSGPGITPEFQQRMFEAFEQGEQSRGPQAGGLGLGLAIARGFAELHGGTLRAEDRTSEGGAVLVLELPRRESSSGEPRARGSTPKLEILLVEDNPDVAQMTKRLLSREGHQVRLLDHGEDVLKEVEARRPDGILCDVGLPGMSGLEVARQLKARPDLATIPMIGMSGYGRSEDLLAAEEAGFDGYLVKPIGRDDLRRKLAELF